MTLADQNKVDDIISYDTQWCQIDMKLTNDCDRLTGRLAGHQLIVIHISLKSCLFY